MENNLKILVVKVKDGPKGKHRNLYNLCKCQKDDYSWQR